jgi:hypothetical protein
MTTAQENYTRWLAAEIQAAIFSKNHFRWFRG